MKIFERMFDKVAIKKKDSSDKYKKMLYKLKQNFIEVRDLIDANKTEYRKSWWFKNGFGISVAKGFSTHGANRGLYEIAVLKGNNITYDTPITDDVVGHLTEKQVLDYGRRVMLLEKRKVKK